jgi:hypothetical protein
VRTRPTCNFVASIALLCTILSVFGCGSSGSSSSSNPPPASNFTMTAGTPRVSLTAGGSPISVSLAITGFANPVHVAASGVPAGVTVSSFSISGAPNGTASASLTASSSTAPGTYTLTFTATDSAQQTQSVTISLTVAATAPPAPAPSYSLSISSVPQLVQGGTATATLTATYTGGFDSPVSVAPVFLPTGISITTGPIELTAANLSQTVTFAASSSTAIATYPVTFTGIGGDLPAQTVSFALTVVAPPPPPSAYVYITTPAGINAYVSPGQGAALALVPGSPFQVSGALIGSAGVPPYDAPNSAPQYLVSYDSTNIYTYLIEPSGAIGPQVSTLSTQSYSGNSCGTPINAVTSAQNVYVDLTNKTTPSCYANQTFNVSNTGLLTFLGSTELDKAVTITSPVFVPSYSASYAYGLQSPVTGTCEDELIGYNLESNGTLTFGNNAITSSPTPQQGWTYVANGPIAATGATSGGLVALPMYQENGPCGAVQSAQLAIFTLDNAGNLISTIPGLGPPLYTDVPVQTYEDMPLLTGAPSSIAFALYGNATVPLAVGGTGGLQVYVETLLEGNTQIIPVGPAVLSASLLSTPIKQVAWDVNNLYAFNGQQLFVFYSTSGFPGAVPNALSTGAPFAISGSNMVLVPIGGPQ